MTPKSPPPTGATPQQEIFQRFPALFSISQKRQPPLPSLRGTAQTIRPANQYSPPPRGSCRLSATGGVFLQKPHHQKGILFSPASSPHRGFQRGSLVSAAASVGDGRSPLATIAPLHSPTGERSHLPVRSALGKRHWRLTPPPYPLLRGVCLYLAASFANAKLDRVSCTKCNMTRAHIPPKGVLSPGYCKGVPKGDEIPL